jgi:glycosyltransferase involved in cell wall biosynthesis
LKIVHALGWYYPESLGGTEVYVAALCRRLLAAGHAVAVVAPDTTGAREYEHEGVPVFRYPVPAAATRDEAQGRVAARGTERLREWLRTARPDVFHLHSIVTGLGVFEAAAARRIGSRIVVTHHLPSLGYVCAAGTLLQWNERPCDGICEPPKCAACVLNTRGLAKEVARIPAAVPVGAGRWLRTLPGRVGTTLSMSATIAANRDMQQRLLDVTDCTVVLNDAARRILETNGAAPASVAVNRLGVSSLASRRNRAATRTPVRFGFVGRFHETKGVYELARAIRGIPRSDFRVEFRGPVSSADDRRVRDEVRRIVEGDARVTFGEAVDHAGISDLLASYDVLCCPSTWFENGPTVAIEAMSVGTPIVGTRFGNFPEIVEDGVNGRLVAPGDEPELGAALADIAAHPEVVDRWREKLPPARTMDDVAGEYLEMYSLLSRAVA